MRFVSVLAIVVGLLSIGYGASLGFDMYKPSKAAANKEMHILPVPQKPAGLYPIVRLHEMTSGRFFCSGTVVSESMIATAAHCVDGAPRNVPSIEIRSGDGKSFNPPIYVSVLGAYGGNDQALLSGDFKKFDIIKMETRAKPIIHSFYRPDNNLILCGYPYGGAMLCLPFKNPRQYIFQVQGESHVYPGMSGGPVIDQWTNRVIAVNTAATESYVIVSPLTEVFSVLGITL